MNVKSPLRSPPLQHTPIAGVTLALLLAVSSLSASPIMVTASTIDSTRYSYDVDYIANSCHAIEYNTLAESGQHIGNEYIVSEVPIPMARHWWKNDGPILPIIIQTTASHDLSIDKLKVERVSAEPAIVERTLHPIAHDQYRHIFNDSKPLLSDYHDYLLRLSFSDKSHYPPLECSRHIIVGEVSYQIIYNLYWQGRFDAIKALMLTYSWDEEGDLPLDDTGFETLLNIVIDSFAQDLSFSSKELKKILTELSQNMMKRHTRKRLTAYLAQLDDTDFSERVNSISSYEFSTATIIHNIEQLIMKQAARSLDQGPDHMGSAFLHLQSAYFSRMYIYLSKIMKNKSARQAMLKSLQQSSRSIGDFLFIQAYSDYAAGKGNDTLKQYLASHPEGAHVQLAKQLIDASLDQE